MYDELQVQGVAGFRQRRSAHALFSYHIFVFIQTQYPLRRARASHPCTLLPLRPQQIHALLVVRKMGKIVGVVHGVSVVSILSADGANSEFKKLCEIAFQVKKV